MGLHRLRSFLAILLAFLLASAAVVATTKKPPLHPINLNTANSVELQQVPGIGPATADKILQMRKSYGPFKSVDDLRAIKGIGPKRMEKMRKYITVGKSAAPKNPANSGTQPPAAKTAPAAAPKSPNRKLPPSAETSADEEKEPT